MNKNKNIPRLRFPGFSGEWISKNLGEVTTYTKGFAFKSDDYTGEGIRIIRVSDLDKDSIKIGNNKVFISIGKKALYTNYVLNKSDIIITTVGSKPELRESAVGRGIYVDSDNYGLLNQNMLKLNNSFDINNRFIFSYINTDEYISYITSIQRGNANQSNIAVTDLFKYRIFITSHDEQGKIAECLSSVDELITAQTDKIAALKDHKKGLMQKLFPQDGAAIPRCRFHEFLNSPPWQEDEFANVINHSSGTSLEEYVSPSGQYKFISIGNYTTDGKYFDNGQRIIANSKTLSKLLNANDLVMVLNDKTAKGDIIGATILIDKENSYIYNQRSERIICNREVRARFLWIYLNSTGFRDKVYQISQGGTQIYVNFPNVKKLGITYPISYTEQEKVAECLTSLDELISLYTKKLSALKEHKKGLMQQLFPAVEKE